MALFLYSAGLIAALIAWTYLIVQSLRGLLNKEPVYFLFHFLGCLAIIFLSWLIMVYPSDCNGMFREVAVFLVWAAMSSIVFLVWPFVLILVHKKQSTLDKSDDNLIDS